MTEKTISGHYGAVYSIEHNNRVFIPKNVDASRTQNNLNLVMAGGKVTEEFPVFKDMKELWGDYRRLCEVYWREREVKYEELKRIAEELRRKLAWMSEWELKLESYDSPVVILLFLFCAPLYFAHGFMIGGEIAEMESIRKELKHSEKEFYHCQKTLRGALREHDRKRGTKLLEKMDYAVGRANHVAKVCVEEMERFATIDEIYDKVFEPGFRKFQAKQRKCRRYQGSYLEQIRERYRAAAGKLERGEKLRVPGEAIEILFCIGDRDNTGYHDAPLDAAKSEKLLWDFCQHLLADPHICTVTLKELRDPAWEPPFKHGLILLNLTGHFDEATPGIHMTVIPYSKGCKRGPEVQPSLGRALTGMGYPSTWKDVLDENGEPVQKRDRNDKLIYNEDGTPRILQEPDKQGIIDWIEEQKEWLQWEMLERYGWQRTYKGSHPRGDLSTPDYKVTRAKERLEALERAANEAICQFAARATEIRAEFQGDVEERIKGSSQLQVIVDYLSTCPEERYEALLEEAVNGMRALSQREQEKAKQQVIQQIRSARRREKKQSKRKRDSPER